MERKEKSENTIKKLVGFQPSQPIDIKPTTKLYVPCECACKVCESFLKKINKE